MKLSLKIISLALLSGGCLYHFQENETHHYHLYIDPGFTDDQRGMIIEAAKDWQEKMGNYLTFDVNAWSADDPDTISIYPTTKIELSKTEGVLGETWNEGINSKIEIATDINNFQQTARHEFGHALSANHIGPGNIMCANDGCASKDITCNDVKEVCSHWNTFSCRAETMPACMSKFTKTNIRRE